MPSRVLKLAFPCLALFAIGAAADPNDWVNVNYVMQAASKPNANLAPAMNAIVSKAGTTAQQGPWTIINKNIKPPSGDVRDYLSWAPYHWPDCNWCSRGTAHFANPNATNGDAGDDTGNAPSDDDNSGGDTGDHAPPETGGVDDPEQESVTTGDSVDKRDDQFSSHVHKTPFGPHRRMKRVQRRRSAAMDTPTPALVRRQYDSTDIPNPTLSDAGIPSIPTSLPTQWTSLKPLQPTTTSNKVAGTGAPMEAPAKTANGQCTPSPTKSLAPSATWTTCPYVVRDGKVNPDTDMLVGPDNTQHMSQSVLYNAIAWSLQKTSKYSQNVVKSIDAFFLSTTTGMHPNVNFGQLVRGPGKDHQIGSFTGILDIRGLVKVVNGLQLLRTGKSTDWTTAREQAMTSWMTSYVGWLQGSSIGKETASKANNHLTFYVNQVTAAKLYLGDTKGATTALQQYFSKQFLDQIAQSGEQPFEAVRTRPFHYRCFNLEAMITNAKLGDQLGVNLWTMKSKYGATIQTALDFTMTVNPKGEDISDIFPHVASVAAAYGDPKGKYAAFLQKNMPDYKSQPFWFYDQSAALPHSPAGSKTKRSDDAASLDHAAVQTPEFNVQAVALNATDSDGSAAPATAQSIPFECPAVFEDAFETELEPGLFVTCDQLRPFYELPIPIGMDS